MSNHFQNNTNNNNWFFWGGAQRNFKSADVFGEQNAQVLRGHRAHTLGGHRVNTPGVHRKKNWLASLNSANPFTSRVTSYGLYPLCTLTLEILMKTLQYCRRKGDLIFKLAEKLALPSGKRKPTPANQEMSGPSLFFDLAKPQNQVLRPFNRRNPP